MSTVFLQWPLQKFNIKENCKRKAVMKSVSTRRGKIIRTELVKGVDITPLQDLKSVWKAIHCEKRKIYPAFPKTLVEVDTKLRNMKNDDGFKYREQQFIYVHDEKNLICMTTKDNLSCMLNCTTFWLMELLIMHQITFYRCIPYIVIQIDTMFH